MADILNLDELENSTLVYKEKEYSFKSPSVEIIDELEKLDAKIDKTASSKEQILQLATEINRLVPELPIELFTGMNMKQLKYSVAYITGGQDAVEAAIQAKKL